MLRQIIWKKHTYSGTMRDLRWWISVFPIMVSVDVFTAYLADEVILWIDCGALFWHHFLAGHCCGARLVEHYAFLLVLFLYPSPFSPSCSTFLRFRSSALFPVTATKLHCPLHLVPFTLPCALCSLSCTNGNVNIPQHTNGHRRAALSKRSSARSKHLHRNSASELNHCMPVLSYH